MHMRERTDGNKIPMMLQLPTETAFYMPHLVICQILTGQLISANKLKSLTSSTGILFILAGKRILTLLMKWLAYHLCIHIYEARIGCCCCWLLRWFIRRVTADQIILLISAHCGWITGGTDGGILRLLCKYFPLLFKLFFSPVAKGHVRMNVKRTR